MAPFAVLVLMEKKMSCFNLTQELEKSLGPVIGQEGFELVDVDWRPEHQGWVLRLYIDRETLPVTIKDCEQMSHKAGVYLDQTGLITHRYSLEVSSPGLNRALKKEKDFNRFAGERVRVELKVALPGTNQKVFVAWIDKVDSGAVLLNQGKGPFRVDLESIVKANLDPVIEI